MKKLNERKVVNVFNVKQPEPESSDITSTTKDNEDI